MPTPAPSKYNVVVLSYGKYVWWPSLGLVDYTPKGKRRGKEIAVLSLQSNNEKGAILASLKHLLAMVRK